MPPAQGRGTHEAPTGSQKTIHQLTPLPHPPHQLTPLPHLPPLQVTAHLRSKYRLDDSDPLGVPEEKVSKQQLVQRLHAMTPPATSARLDIPKWLLRYKQCFQVVDTIAKGLPLPRWFAAEIEPLPQELAGREPRDLPSPSAAHASLLPPPTSPPAGGSGEGGVRPHVRCRSAGTVQTVEALFDRNRCGSNASLDVQRTRVEFSGMATVLLTSPVPPEGVHVMEFDVLGRDQCLVGIASPDCDVETYLGHRRGGYGFFAAEGTLKVDGDWKGGHGLCKFKRGDRVGVHVDMSRRTLQFSVSRWVTEAAPEAGAAGAAGAGDRGAAGSSPDGGRRWVTTLLERTVEGVPSLVYFAVGGAAGGDLSIAGGSSSVSAGEERIAMNDVDADGGYDNPNWPRQLDEQLVDLLNEKASEHRKHPRNIRSSTLLHDQEAAGIICSMADDTDDAPAALRPRRAGETAQSASGGEDEEAGVGLPGAAQGAGAHDAPRSTLSGLALARGAGWGEEGGFGEMGAAGSAITGSTPSASPALRAQHGLGGRGWERTSAGLGERASGGGGAAAAASAAGSGVRPVPFSLYGTDDDASPWHGDDDASGEAGARLGGAGLEGVEADARVRWQAEAPGKETSLVGSRSVGPWLALGCRISALGVTLSCFWC